MEINVKQLNPTGNPKVRYAVHYNDRNYEYALHSGKGHFLRNIADVVNVLEYCVTGDLKKELYKPSEKLYNFEVIRLVNDKPDEKWIETDDKTLFHDALKIVVGQIINDTIQRNA
jgi:hypothetical protein